MELVVCTQPVFLRGFSWCANGEGVQIECDVLLLALVRVSVIDIYQAWVISSNLVQRAESVFNIFDNGPVIPACEVELFVGKVNRLQQDGQKFGDMVSSYTYGNTNATRIIVFNGNKSDSPRLWYHHAILYACYRSRHSADVHNTGGSDT